MKLDDLTLGEVKQLKNMFNGVEKTEKSPFEIGKNYLIRTVTMTQTGKLTALYEKELVLETAAALKTCEFCEVDSRYREVCRVEPFTNPVIVSRGAIIDATEIAKLPTKQK